MLDNKINTKLAINDARYKLIQREFENMKNRIYDELEDMEKLINAMKLPDNENVKEN